MAVVCVDACLAAKWVVPEPDSARAIALLREWQDAASLCIVPPFFWAELGTILRKYAVRGLMADEDTRAGLEAVLAMDLWSAEVPWLRAYDLSRSIGHAHLYDSCYLAVAEAFGAEFWTADQALFGLAAPHLGWIHLL